MFPDLVYLTEQAERRSGDWSLAPYVAPSAFGGTYAIAGMLTSIPFNVWIAIGSILLPFALGLIKTLRGDEAAALKAEIAGLRLAIQATTRAEETQRILAANAVAELERIRAQRGGTDPGKSNDAPS